MRTVIELASAIQSGDENLLKRGLTMSPVTHKLMIGTKETMVESDQWSVQYDAGYGPAAIARINKSEVQANHWVKAGRLLIQSVVQTKMDRKTQLVVVHENHTLVTKVLVKSLLGRMWIQFLDSITDGQLKLCVVCRKPFAAKRTSNTTCGRACVQRAHEKKKRKTVAKKTPVKKKAARRKKAPNKGRSNHGTQTRKR